jgi:hypothetical protein
MQKNIAVIVRDRQDEALRMSAGLILADDALHLFVLDRKLEPTEGNTMNVDLLRDMDQKVYTNFPAGAWSCCRTEIAAKLLACDNILLLSAEVRKGNAVSRLGADRRPSSDARKGHEVAVIDLRTDTDYARIVDQIAAGQGHFLVEVNA